MARIPAVEVERLKSEISLDRLVEAAGIELKRAGVDLIGCCPFHADKTPSPVISPRKNRWHCLGAHIIELIRHALGHQHPVSLVGHHYCAVIRMQIDSAILHLGLLG